MTNETETEQGTTRGKVAKTAGSSGAVLALGVSLVAATPGAAGAGGPIVVDSLADDGSGGTTLREAIDSAVDGSVITFAPGLTGTITLNGSQITIDDAIEIQGPGESVITVSGDDNSRIFYINADDDDAVTISGLTLSSGDVGGHGGAIHADNTGSFTLRDSTIVDNESSSNGGGVSLDNVTGDVTISGSTFFQNDADSDGGGLSVGSVTGTVTVSSTEFDENFARSDGGGAVFQDDIATITLTSLTVTDNAAPYDQAGGLFFYGLGTDDPDGTQVTISSSTITGNTGDEGGGINFYRTFGTLGITDSTIADNDAAYGGGIRIYASGETTIERSTISGNDANVYVGEGSSGGYGGGINHNYSDELTIINSTISGNSAEVGGGGIWTGDDAAMVTLQHVTMTDNTADEVGGGIFASDSDGLDIDHTIVAGNGDEDLAGDTTATVSNSLIGDADTGGVVITDGGNNDIGVADAGLLPLTDNGGPTATHALAATSPAMEAGDPAFAPPPATDQRGLPRVQGTIEKGAWEAPGDPTTPTTPTTEPDGGTQGAGVTNAPAATPTTANPDFTG